MTSADFDSFLTDGRITKPIVDSPRIDVRRLDAWCKENGRTPESLNKKEIAMFVIT